jgi:hypothetical protein
MAWAASTYGNRTVIAAMTLIYQNEMFKKMVMDFPLYNFNGIDITPARIVAVFVVTKMAHDFCELKGLDCRSGGYFEMNRDFCIFPSRCSVPKFRFSFDA